MAKKSHMIALLLSLFLGGIGIDRFYLGHKGMGFFKMFTCGGFGVLALYDFFKILWKGNYEDVEWD